jgi:hypothetical protein
MERLEVNHFEYTSPFQWTKNVAPAFHETSRFGKRRLYDYMRTDPGMHLVD